MAVVMTPPTNFPRRINMYVPAMQYASDVNMYNATRVSFLAPAAPVTNNILNAQSVATAVTVDLTGNVNAQNILDPFGRTIQLIANAANATVVTVRGSDYLGQPITANVTMTGAVAVETRKAFKYVDSVTLPLVAAGTVSMGWGGTLGLPYKALRAVAEVANGANATVGTFTAPALFDPATATTTDPRGLYKPTTALNGANIISAIFDMANDINSNNNGGLHGIRAA